MKEMKLMMKMLLIMKLKIIRKRNKNNQLVNNLKYLLVMVDLYKK